MLPADTYTVSQLGQELQLILSETLSGVWLAGEVRRVTKSRGGHLYFELVEKGAGDSVVGSIQAVLFRRDYLRVSRVLARAGVELSEGQTVRCFGAVDFYPAGGRLQFIARDADPVFSLGDLARRRQQTLKALAERQLLEKNGELRFPLLPLTINLVTSLGSAAERDFITTLEQSPYAFNVRVLDASMQGATAEKEIVRRLAQSGKTDGVVVLIRGGGSKTDLAAFDSLAVAEAIATCPMPVLTGLGHQIDEAVADLVAHRAFKTPTAVGEFLCRRVESLDQGMNEMARRLAESAAKLLFNRRQRFTAAELKIQSARARVHKASSALESVAQRLQLLGLASIREAARSLEGIEGRLRRATKPTLVAARSRSDDVAGQLTKAVQRRLVEATHRLRGVQRLLDQLSPERTLRRGFSITRDRHGAVVRRAAEVERGSSVFTELAEGSVESTVERTVERVIESTAESADADSRREQTKRP